VARTWGYWTQAKLKILAEYLSAFATAAKNQQERVYLDAFAGEGTGIDRLTGEQFEGSARIALEIPDPPFTRLSFFEIASRRATALERQLVADYPRRDITVYRGDCNDAITKALADLQGVRWAPTFAFIDPDGMELAWTTLQHLAEHKLGYRRTGDRKREYKVEIWMLFPSGGLMRTLQLRGSVPDRDKSRATRLFGIDEWEAIHQLRRDNELSGAEARDEYVNLMRWRLEHVLGYRWTHPLEVKNLRGSPLYHMILATDNDAGTRIISNLYAKAASEIPRMRNEIVDRLRAQERLFEVSTVSPSVTYEYEAPHGPSGGGDAS
jgi:three-Cys-motif partner protein